MQRSEQIALGKRLFDYIENEKSATWDAIYHQPIDEYLSTEQAATERRIFFREDLLCVGLSDRLSGPGTYFTDELSGVPLLLTRGQDNQVRGFLNVCRHRGSAVAKHCGKAKAFVCPYHAWTYDLSGKLVARPQDDFFDGASRNDYGLTELQTIEHHGMIWICPTPGKAIDLEEKLAGLSTELAAYDLGSFVHYDSCIMHRKMNWKLVVDTFLESYHFCVLHKETICSIFYDNLTTFDAWGDNFRICSARRTIGELKSRPEKDWDVMPHIVGIYILFPNTVLVWQLDHVELWHIYPSPDNPEEAALRLDLYTPEPAVTEKAKQYWDKNLELVVKVVQEEDFPVGETIQNGFHSAAQRHVTFGSNEPALSFFHEAITRAVSNA